MKIEEQVLTIDQMNHLKELGLEVKDTAMCWVNARVGHNFVAPIDIIFHNDKIPTLTLQEILELLPKSIVSNEYWYSLYVDYEYRNISYSYKNGDELSAEETFEIEGDSSNSLLQAAYEALCWCTENGYLNKE